MDKWILFVEAHWRLIVGLGVLGVVLFLGNRFLDNQHDSLVAENAVAQQQLAEQVKQNQQLAAQFATMKADYDKREAQWRAQEVSLLAAIANRNQETTHQQQVDQTLPLVELAKRWAFLVHAEPETIQVSNSTLSASEQTSRTTVQNLEEIPTLRANIQDQESLLQNKDQQITGLRGLNTNLVSQVDGLRSEIEKQKTACKIKEDLIKSKARRAKVKWFVAGVGTGAGLAIKFILF